MHVPGHARAFIHEPGPLVDAAGTVNTALLWAKIMYLERRELDLVSVAALPALGALLDSSKLVRILGLGRFWIDDTGQERREVDYPTYTVDLLAGLHAMSTELIFLLTSSGREVGIFLGTPGSPGLTPAAATSLLTGALRGAFPGIRVGAPPAPAVLAAARAHLASGIAAMLTGPPAVPLTPDAAGPSRRNEERLERLLRGLEGEPWTYVVCASPLPEGAATQGLWDTLNEITAVSPALKLQSAVGRAGSLETTRRDAQYYSAALETLFQRCQAGRNQGLWQVRTYLAALHEGVLNKALGLLRATLSGVSEQPEPLRSILCRPGAVAPPIDLSSVLTSAELGALVQLPRQETPGYAIQEYARFDTDVPAAAGPALELGTVQDGTRDTGLPFGVPLADLPKHALICGVTGSGKTTTCLHILNSLWNAGRGVPFLVIEPAKTEYRELLNAADLAASLRIYTLGDERWAGFRINPFEFEWRPDGSGLHVQSHIDYLRSLFTASFVLYPPMPYVLEVALHEIYEDKGWDLATSRNRRLSAVVLRDPAALARLQGYLYPTLSELYDKIESVVDALGYEERIRMDVQAGLKARIHSLRVGGKGLMLDTRRGVPMADLLRYPTLLELQAVGDDEEKAFLIGLLLTRVYEYRHVECGQQPRPGLAHVTLIEEAHRLLANAPTPAGGDSANVAGKAVETFTNMIAEIRAYGESVLIAEQIPTRLAPGAIKNTNLKLLHRLVAQDDRDVVGATMNFTPAQNRFVTTLPTGYAAAYAEGADQAYLIHVPDPAGRFLPAVRRGVANAALQQTMRARGAAPAAPFPWCNGLCNAATGGESCDSAARAAALAGPLRDRIAVYLASAVENPAYFATGYDALAGAAEAALDRGDLPPRPRRALTTCTLLWGLRALLDERGRQYRWSYEHLDDLQNRVPPIVGAVAGGRAGGTAPGALATTLGHEIVAFSTTYRRACVRLGPFHDCASCRHQCQFRYDAARVLRTSWISRACTDALTNSKDEAALWDQLADLGAEAAHAQLASGVAGALEDAALCYLRQLVARRNYSPRFQARLLAEVSGRLAARQLTPRSL